MQSQQSDKLYSSFKNLSTKEKKILMKGKSETINEEDNLNRNNLIEPFELNKMHCVVESSGSNSFSEMEASHYGKRAG